MNIITLEHSGHSSKKDPTLSPTLVSIRKVASIFQGRFFFMTRAGKLFQKETLLPTPIFARANVSFRFREVLFASNILGTS